MTPRTLYSIRDALGRELWWTTARKRAVVLVDDLNAIGEGAYVKSDGTAGKWFEGYAPKVMCGDTLPVAVWKCSPAKPSKPRKPKRDILDGGAPHRDCDCMDCRPWTS